jgi:hypothetical protein
LGGDKVFPVTVPPPRTVLSLFRILLAISASSLFLLGFPSGDSTL